MAVILNAFLSFLLVYKYIGLFGVALLAAFALPLPSSSILAAAGAFSAQGYFSITTVLAVALLGNITGDALGYFIARFYGTRFLKKIGLEKALSSRLYISLTKYMQHFSYSLIFFSRFLTGVGPLINIVSGITHVKYRVFFGIGILGEIAYVLVYGLVGYYLGSEWESNLGFLFEATSVIIVFGITLSLIQYGVFKRMKKGTQ
jgi:membrane protein DedA with SNARE-associated domain